VLRKLAFTPQTFEDLGVEKEVAIRRRIAKESVHQLYVIFDLTWIQSRFNKQRGDFDDLRSYNDYLEEVEDIGETSSIALFFSSILQTAFNLINNIDIPQTEARITAYRAANAVITAANAQREEAYALSLKEQEEFERKEREFRAAELRREEDAEREEREKTQQELIDKLETSTKDARKLVAKSKANALKKASTKPATVDMGDYAKLLKTRTTKATVPDEPHVPLQDDWYAYEDMFTLNPEGYNDVFSEAVRKDREGIMRGGGYRVEEAWERAIRLAVAGLDLAPLSGLDEPSVSSAVDAGGDVIMASA
jgi:CDK-activating kinase assembly factor MAT1